MSKGSGETRNVAANARVFVDFTEQHHAEQELRQLSGRLITAYEQERIRFSHLLTPPATDPPRMFQAYRLIVADVHNPFGGGLIRGALWC